MGRLGGGCCTCMCGSRSSDKCGGGVVVVGVVVRVWNG